MPKVFILILNWNNALDTIECVESVLKLNYPLYEVVLIDNASTDDSVNILKNRFPMITLICTASNLGYAGGNNQGIKYALKNKAEYIWILNNDTTVEFDSLAEMMKVSISDSSIGMVGSKIFFYSSPDLLWCVGGGALDVDKGGSTSLYGWMQKDKGQYNYISDIDYVAGTSLLVKSSVIDRIGLIPEEYFLYFEETDWNYKAKMAGFRTVVAHNAFVKHKVTLGNERITRNHVYYMTRNRFLLIKKIKPSALWCCVKYQFNSSIQLLVNLYKSGDNTKFTECLKAVLLAWWHGLVTNHSGPLLLFHFF